MFDTRDHTCSFAFRRVPLDQDQLAHDAARRLSTQRLMKDF